MLNQIITTKYGQLRGVEEEGVMLFKGVPYAAPPVGELRWKPPVDPAPWEGVRECDTYAPPRHPAGSAPTVPKSSRSPKPGPMSSAM